MDICEIRLRADLAAAAFRLGQARDRWRFVRLDFPYVRVSLPKPNGKDGPPRFLLRVDATGYRGALTAQLWDARIDQALAVDLLPQGTNGTVLTGFSPAAGPCLYHPIDRMARPHWPQQHPALAWKDGDDIVTFLEVVHDLLHDSTYLRSASPAAAAELPETPLERDPT